MENYIVIENLDLRNLIINVNNKIRLGYIPLGGICLSDTSRRVYIQAMILNK